MPEGATVRYDEEWDILYAHTDDKVRDSLELNNFVIDFSMDNRVVGIEIMDASKTISEIIGRKIGAAALSKIDRASISVSVGKDLSYIFLTVSMSADKAKTELRIPVVAPTPVMRVGS